MKRTGQTGLFLFIPALLASLPAVSAQDTQPTTRDLLDEFDQRLVELDRKYDDGHGPLVVRADRRDGLRMETADGTSHIRIGGQIQSDAAWFCDKDASVGELEDKIECRRARLFVSGVIRENVVFEVEYDFAGGDPDFEDVYLGIRHLPVIGHVRVGHFKEPLSIEELISNNHTTFMERSLANVFAPSRNHGLMIYDTAFADRATWAVGVFRETDDFSDCSGDTDCSYTGRITCLPWYRDDGARLLHLGAAYSRRSPNNRLLSYGQRPESHLAPDFVDTGQFQARRADLIGLETALVHGPLTLQGEYIQNIVDAINSRDVCFQAFYIQAAWFLTGETRPYDRETGVFDRLIPKKSFCCPNGQRGFGAWEIAARYSYLDLDDGPIEGGRLSDLTLGLNWYLNPNARVMWNYVLADLAGDGDAGIFQIRLQIDF
ncbi:MAG: porin [Phycisphaerae bacterium]|nr:porin [Phycisphaerae bacterium]